LGKTADCTSMCYNKLSLAEKEIERLYDCILDFKNIRYLDINTNSISNISLLVEFPELVSLNASKNQINSLDVFSDANVLKNLQFLNLSTNKITKLTQIALPALRRLNLNENEIATIEGWVGHDTLEYLELRKNKLKKLTGLKNMKNLVELYLSENQISDFRGLENLPSLKKLYLRNNKIKKLLKPFPHLPSLYHINLRENQIEKITEFDKIEKHIKSITFAANPANEELG
jgi:internalin A